MPIWAWIIIGLLVLIWWRLLPERPPEPPWIGYDPNCPICRAQMRAKVDAFLKEADNLT
jgi:hypothetical protein